MIDSTYVKAHRTSASMTCSDSKRNIGRSHGDLTPKVHLLCNEYGLPVDFLITGGEVHDVKPAPELVAINKMSGLIADKAYGFKKLRDLLAKLRRKACMSVESNAKIKISYARNIYKKRHRIENIFA